MVDFDRRVFDRDWNFFVSQKVKPLIWQGSELAILEIILLIEYDDILREKF